MKPHILHRSLRSRGVRFIADGDSFRVQAPKNVLSDTDKLLLRQHKQDIAVLVAESCQGCGTPLYYPESLAVRTCTTCRR